MLPFPTLWRIARRDLAARIRGLRLLAVCLFLGVATLAAIGREAKGDALWTRLGASPAAAGAGE